MTDFFLPSNFKMYKFITEESFDSTCTEVFFVKENEMGNNAKIFFGVGREPQSFVLLMRDVVRQLLDNMHLL